jgi:hypothetical protein
VRLVGVEANGHTDAHLLEFLDAAMGLQMHLAEDGI